jgi:hypothetical protein
MRNNKGEHNSNDIKTDNKPGPSPNIKPSTVKNNPPPKGGPGK